MDLVTAKFLVGGIVELIEALPGIVEAIKKMDAPDGEKAGLIARIRAAQEGLPVWD